MAVDVFEPIPNCFMLVHKKTTHLAKMFVRFQELYESTNPKFRNKPFKFKRFRRWYKKKHKGKFTYYNDWAGFNVPDHIVDRFRAGDMGKLSKKEKEFLEIVPKYHKDTKHYVIGVGKGDKVTKLHELGHALYYLHYPYKAHVSHILQIYERSSIKHFKNIKRLKKHLRKIGYTEEVLKDECHAYLMADRKYLKSKGIWRKSFEPIRKELRKTFKKQICLYSGRNIVI